jgi:SPP1 family predicted phage head-tail adaptor
MEHKPVASGDLRHSMEFYSKTETPDGQGGVAHTPKLECTLRAGIKALTSYETMVAQSRMLETTHRITVRFAAVDPKWYIKWGSRYFSIDGIINVNEENRQLVISVTEKKPEGVNI